MRVLARISALCALWTVGCSLYSPEVELDGARTALPDEYPEVLAPEAAEPPVSYERYWERFGSATLDRLVKAAIDGNYDLAAMSAVVRQAGFGARVTWSERLPSFSYDLGIGYTDRRSSVAGLQRAPGWVANIGVAGAYEADLWGRARSYNLSAESRFEAARWDLAAARVTVASEVVLRWLEIQTAHAQLDLLTRQARQIERTTELIELRFRQGDAAWTDVLALRQTLSGIAAAQAATGDTLAGATAELRLLVGEEYSALAEVGVERLPDVPALPNTGLPAALVEQRPDVQASWYRTLAAGWKASAKQAERLPSLNIGGSFSFAGSNPAMFFESWIASVAAGITGPLFEFMGRKYAADEAAAATDVAMERLKQVLRSAFRDVERAMAANRYLAQRKAAVDERLSVACERARQLEYRYRQGVASYLDLYLAELDRMDAQRAAIAARADLLGQRVQLARALGGGWPEPSAKNGAQGAP